MRDRATRRQRAAGGPGTRSRPGMENCMNIQYSIRRKRAAQASTLRRVCRACRRAAAFRRRDLGLTHSNGQTNCHPAI
ncbi:hypothetical protein DB771_16225 [Burkholderia sp. AU29985]|nr:hypothetical protein DB771_16225 [Burkholderia sp. AU29985]